MYYFCTKCKQIYWNNFDEINSFSLGGRYKGRLCPKVNCHGTVVEIDELIMPSIEEFNKAGYKTNYSCSGHPYENIPTPYVSFDEYYFFPLDKIPSTWSWDKKNNTLYANTIQPDSSVKEKIEYITKVNIDLYEFAKSLNN